MAFKIVRKSISKYDENELLLPSKKQIAYVDAADDEFVDDALKSVYADLFAEASENDLTQFALSVVSGRKEESVRAAINAYNDFARDDITVYFLIEPEHKGPHFVRTLFRRADYVPSASRMQNACAPSRSMPKKGEDIGGKGRENTCEDAVCEMAALSMREEVVCEKASVPYDYDEENARRLEEKLRERMLHKADSFSEYLLYLIERKGMTNAEVYKRAIVDKKVFSKIKNDKDYHPTKITALCLCVGAQLSIDETKDLLQRAGYAISPSDSVDIIFSYYIENGLYDMIDIDIQLENFGLPCIIA